MPALHFQDVSPAHRTSFDMVLTETFAGQSNSGDSITQKVQAKSGCFDICGEAVAQRNYRSEYNADIKLLSGCCDLDMRGSVENPSRYTVPNMLVREAMGRATPDDIATLDELTNRALFNLSSEDERRLGKLPVDSFVLV